MLLFVFDVELFKFELNAPLFELVLKFELPT